MKLNKGLFNLKKYFFLIAGLCFFNLFAQKSDKFTLVIDPGHGNYDGAHRTYPDLGAVWEDHIVLGIGLKLGKLLQKDKDIKVIFTRTSDFKPSLTDRTNLANRNHADLFVSIHVNSTPYKSSTAIGTETYVQGPNQNNQNLEVAKRENSVIYLDEKDKQTFGSYDATSPESLIALKLQQSKYLQKSLLIGSLVEENFIKSGRPSRGVKQTNLHVLRQNAMPSILVETGFVTNYEDARYLTSEKGQQEIAQVLYDAILKYKKAVDRESKQIVAVPKEEPVIEKPLDSDYRILLMSSNTRYGENDPALRGFKYILPIKENGLYKYYYAVTNVESQRKANLQRAKDAGFSNAWSEAFKPNEELKKGYYTIEVGVYDKKLKKNDPLLLKLPAVKWERKGGSYLYTYGHVKTLEAALQLQEQIEHKGISPTTIEIKN